MKKKRKYIYLDERISGILAIGGFIFIITGVVYYYFRLKSTGSKFIVSRGIPNSLNIEQQTISWEGLILIG